MYSFKKSGCASKKLRGHLKTVYKCFGLRSGTEKGALLTVFSHGSGAPRIQTLRGRRLREEFLFLEGL